MQSAIERQGYALSRGGMLKAQWRIIVALMLHDVKSRMGGNALGFLVMGVAWPLTHILVIVAMYAGLGRVAPYGDSAALWTATGVVPYMAFQYMSRFIVLGIPMNKWLLSFPIVKATDILLARAIIEVLNAGMVVLVIFLIFWALGIDFMPRDVVQAGAAMLAMMLLGMGFGVINGIITAAIPVWGMIFFLCQLLYWLSSGILILPESLPLSVQNILAYLPWFQGVEWMRSAYYQGYGQNILDRTYLLSFGAATLVIGLSLERLIRGKLLSW